MLTNCIANEASNASLPGTQVCNTHQSLIKRPNSASSPGSQVCNTDQSLTKRNLKKNPRTAAHKCGLLHEDMWATGDGLNVCSPVQSFNKIVEYPTLNSFCESDELCCDTEQSFMNRDLENKARTNTSQSCGL